MIILEVLGTLKDGDNSEVVSDGTYRKSDRKW